MLRVGVVEWRVGLGVFVKNQLSRSAGVIVLGLNGIAPLLMMPACLVWSLSIFMLGVVCICGLIAYGDRISDS